MTPLARLNALAAVRPLPPRAWDAIEDALRRVEFEIEMHDSRDVKPGRFQDMADRRAWQVRVRGIAA